MPNKLTEDEKKDLLKTAKKVLTAKEFKTVNKAAQNVLSKAPNVDTDNIMDVLDWIEEYILALKNT